MMEMFQIIVENVNDLTNRFELLKPWVPPKYFRIDCMKECLDIEWSKKEPGAKIIKVTYK